MPRGQGYAEAGQVIAGRYRLVGVLGSGGMGTVWRAHDVLLDRPVAAKVLNVFFGQDSEELNRRERSLREARATARINHPNVVRVYDYVEDDDRLWIVMELVAARSLDTVLAEDGPLSPRDAAAIGIQVARALRAVHAHGVLHRDVKPGNVLIEPDGHAVLTDFGIAALEGTTGLTGTGSIVGSPEFMAPERIESENPGPASDLWSLGVTMCAAVTGTSPFRRPTPVATLAAIVINQPEVPDGIGPLEPLVRALFERDPDKRPDAAAVMDTLETILTNASPQHATDPTQVVTALPAGAQTWEMSHGRGPAAEAEAAESTASLATPGATAAEGQATSDLAAPSRAGSRTREDAAAAATVLSSPPSARTTPRTVEELPGIRPESAPPPGRDGGSGAWWRRRAVLVPSAAAVVVAIVVSVALALGGGDDGKKRSETIGQGSTPTAADSPGTSGTSGGSSGATAGTRPTPAARAGAPAYPPVALAAAPDGTSVTTADESRFTWPVPGTWTRAERDQTISYVSANRQSVLAARTAFKQTDDLLGAWREEERKAPAVLADYRRVLFEERTIRGNPGVVWEYTWTEAGVERHAVLAAFLESGLYVEVDVFSNPATWDRDQELFHWALQNLRLATNAPAAG